MDISGTVRGTGGVTLGPTEPGAAIHISYGSLPRPPSRLTHRLLGQPVHPNFPEQSHLLLPCLTRTREQDVIIMSLVLRRKARLREK